MLCVLNGKSAKLGSLFSALQSYSLFKHIAILLWETSKLMVMPTWNDTHPLVEIQNVDGRLIQVSRAVGEGVIQDGWSGQWVQKDLRTAVVSIDTTVELILLEFDFTWPASMNQVRLQTFHLLVRHKLHRFNGSQKNPLPNAQIITPPNNLPLF